MELAPQDHPPEAPSSGRPWVALLVSLAIGAGLLALAARSLDFDGIRAYLAEVDGGRVAGAAALYGALFGVVHLIRMARWSFLLRHLGPVPFGAVMRAAAIGFTAIILMPLRLGELVRPYVLSRQTDVSMSAALGTAVVERVVDGLFISLLLFLTLATYRGTGSTGFAMAIGAVCLGIFLGALAVCVGALWRRELTLGLVARLAGLASPKLADKLVGLLEQFLQGVESLREGRALVSFLGLTVAYWVINGLSIAVMAQVGFGLALGPWEGMTVLAVLVVGIMIPAGPGLAGNYELFALEALGLFLPAGEVAVAGAAFVALMHLVQFTVQVIPGLVLVWASGGRIGAMARSARASV